MNGVKQVGLALAVATLALVTTSAYAQTQGTQKPFQPEVGQAGKDVVWVPTPQATVDKMLELTKLTAKDYLMDLGSGNGITVITAARKGATALGIEYNPDMVELSKRLAAEAGVSDKATFVKADLFEADLSKATVITMFLLPDINLRLRPKILDLKPGTRVASNTFTMGDWEPDERVEVKDCSNWCTALYWMVPAKVAGTWALGQQTLTLTQQYQVVTGTLDTTPITDGKLAGDEITFTVGAVRTYTVKSRDTLSKVAKETLGKAASYMAIFDANKDQLSDPDKIKPGQVLKILSADGQKYSGRVNGNTITGTGWTATQK